MKAKKFDKTLTIKKQTISNLDNTDLNSAKGGMLGDFTKRPACKSGRCNYADSEPTWCIC